MKFDIEPGKYVLAVSGGVDSMALLDMLSRQPGIDLVAAHFNHGIRSDSDKDEELVKAAANTYEVLLETKKEKLGSGASEELARTRRYEFLEAVRLKHQADKIITAHHQDDLIETAFMNILRGTGYRGLAAISLNPHIGRPLLHVSKGDVIAYAKKQKLKWRDDITNEDTDYLRNYIRKHIMAKLDANTRKDILESIDKAVLSSKRISPLLESFSKDIKSTSKIDRKKFVQLPLEVAAELMAFWLRELDIKNYDKKTIQRLCVALKTGLPGTRYNVQGNCWLVVDTHSAHFAFTG